MKELTPIGRTPDGELADRFLQLNRQVTVFSLETNPPRLPWEQGAAVLLRPLMLWKAGGKLSHWFDWKHLPEDIDITGGAVIPADPNAHPINTTNVITDRVANIRMSLGGWKSGYMVGPEPNDEAAYEQGWRFAFQRSELRQYSKIVNHSPIVVLAGSTPVFVSGIERNSFAQVPLQIAGPYQARGRLPIQ